MKKKKQLKILFFIIIFLVAGFLFFSDTVSAQSVDYIPISPLPGITDCDSSFGDEVCDTNISSYLQNMFKLSLGIAGVLAVLMIVIGGIQYLLSNAFTNKEEAKKTMTAAIWGLLILFASVLILQTINPKILSLEFNLPEREPDKKNDISKDPDALPSAITPPTEAQKKEAASRGEEVSLTYTIGRGGGLTGLRTFSEKCTKSGGGIRGGPPPQSNPYVCVKKKE